MHLRWNHINRVAYANNNSDQEPRPDERGGMQFGMRAVKKVLLLGLIVFCHACQNSAPSGVVDDRDLVTHLTLHPAGSTKTFAGLATAVPSHVIASSWWRMRGLISKSSRTRETYRGFSVVEVPGFGASVVLLPTSYSEAYPWVVICDGPGMSEPVGDCAIKGNSGTWVAEVPIKTVDMGIFPVIVQAIQDTLPPKSTANTP